MRRGVAAAESIRDISGHDRGAVYTPAHLAEWVAARVLEALPQRPATIVDFACGQGALLAALRRGAPGLRLVGVDISSGDLAAAARVVPRARLIEADALAPEPELGSLAAVPAALGLPRVDGVVLNPPWGIALPHSAQDLRRRGYTLARGQFDSASLFVELALESLRPGGVAGFILPDSIFFPAHSSLRELLVQRSELVLLARLGEGLFPDVYRGVAVVVLRKAHAEPGHSVECVRLSPEDRRALRDGSATLTEIAERRKHLVEQARFARSKAVDFDITVRERHVAFIERMRARADGWTRWFTSGRGVELSKHGEIVSCPECGHSRPRPRKPKPLTCSACGVTSEHEGLRSDTIVRPLGRATGRWAPLVGGDDVDRYRVAPTREIRTGVPGINYKPGHESAGSRILVRKTGIGLRAALIDGPAHTTQVVFQYRPLPDAPALMAPYVLGLMCSRTMLAFHLLVSGESEWRSHPYVTQKVINALPIPDPTQAARWGRAEAIARLSTALMTGEGGMAIDYELEGIVAGLYGLEQSDLAAIARVLDEAQGLSGIRELRFASGAIRPLDV